MGKKKKRNGADHAHARGRATWESNRQKPEGAKGIIMARRMHNSASNATDSLISRPVFLLSSANTDFSWPNAVRVCCTLCSYPVRRCWCRFCWSSSFLYHTLSCAKWNERGMKKKSGLTGCCSSSAWTKEPGNVVLFLFFTSTSEKQLDIGEGGCAQRRCDSGPHGFVLPDA